MNLNVNDFKDVGKQNDRSTWSDEELLKNIQVLQCLTVYFLARKEPLIHFGLQLELNTLESYARARGWACDEGYNWRIVRKREYNTLPSERGIVP